MPDGQDLPPPPGILGELGKDPQNPTVHFYGHMDVQPAKKEDSWKTNPYTVTKINGCAINFKFVIEGKEEAGSLGLEKLLEEESQCFFSDVDYIVISHNLWLSNKKPAFTYGSWEAECGTKGPLRLNFGGIIHMLLMDLIALLESLVDPTGRIQIPGIYGSVSAWMEEDRKLYEMIEFDLEEHRNNSGMKKFLYGSKEEILLHLWHYPSLCVHGTEGASHEPGTKTVIGKFSIHQVLHMDLLVVKQEVVEHLESVFYKRNHPNQP